MKKVKKISSSRLTKKTAKIKTNQKPGSIEDASFFKRKMQKGARMLSIAGLPK
jgi:hypothetical protein